MAPTGYYLELERGWEKELARLRMAGWVVHVLTGAIPLQLEGETPTGERFYVRAKEDDLMLAIGGADPSDCAPWERALPHADASYIPAAEGIPLIVRLYEDFVRETYP
jgi:hypothetical protein